MTDARTGGGNGTSEAEVRERVAVLKRFKELLERQKSRFESYLDVLDRQKDDITNDEVDKLVAHVELEQQVVAEIFAFQKVIDPMEALYESARGHSTRDIPELKASVEELRREVLRRNAENRALLKDRMEAIRGEIASVRANPLYRKKSVYASQGGATVVDIET